MGGKEASCWVNDLIRQEGADSVPRRVVGLDQEHSRVSCRKPRDLGKLRRGGGGVCVDGTVGVPGRPLLRAPFFSWK